MDDTQPNVLTEGDDGVYEPGTESVHFERLNALGASLQSKLDEDIAWRAETGIELEWQDADDAFQGHDDANQVRKPRTLDGPFTTNGDRGARSAPRSRVFLNITGAYVEAAAARIGDMILKGDDTNWAIRPTPLQDEELDMAMDAPDAPAGFLSTLGQPAQAMPPMQQTPIAAAVQGQSAPGAQPPEVKSAPVPVYPDSGAGTNPAINMQASQGDAVQPDAPAPQNAPSAPSAPAAADQAAQLQAAAEASAALATKQIEDWLIECQYHAEMRKVLEDAARIGTGILKGPFPVSRTAKRTTRGPMGMMRETFTSISPASRRVSIWDIFPAAGCGEDMQNGSHIWERDTMSTRKLRSLLNDDALGYIPEQVQRVLEGDPDRTDRKLTNKGDNNRVAEKNTYEVWYFTGMLERDDLVAAGLPEGDIPEGAVQVPAIVHMIDGIVIKASLNPLDDGSFPYDVLPWKRRTGLPWGRGVGWQMLTPQRVINAAARSMMENLGLASGPQIAVNRGIIRPADGIWELTPRKLWFMVKDPADPNNAHKIDDAISFFMPPSITNEFMSVIQFAQKLAEDVTGLPQLMQGSQGSSPDTVGGMTILNNNASTVLRRIARQVDDKVTEPHIRRYYDWLMEYGENDKAKGDFQIDARGSTALVDRELSKQVIMQMLPMSLNPAYGASPARVYEEAVKANDMDPKRFQLTDEEKQKLAQQPPPVPESVQVAKVNADSRVAIAQAANKAAMDRESMKDATEKYLAEKEGNMRWQTALMELAVQQKITLDQAKTELFLGVSKLNTQAALSAHAAVGKSVPQVTTPPDEPAGRAAPGQAWQQ